MGLLVILFLCQSAYAEQLNCANGMECTQTKTTMSCKCKGEPEVQAEPVGYWESRKAYWREQAATKEQRRGKGCKSGLECGIGLSCEKENFRDTWGHCD